jgi:DNA replicative helicase MCM subunit Mcm2 (Cdc46/Mcm family)
VRAIEYYKDIDLRRFRSTVAEALKTLVPEARLKKERTAAPASVPAQKREIPKAKREPEPKEDELHEVKVGADEEDTVLKIIDSLVSGNRGAPWDKMVEAAKAKRIDKVRLEEIVASLLDKGEIYEPELGMMKRI